jgi:hypothetical protein
MWLQKVTSKKTKSGDGSRVRAGVGSRSESGSVSQRYGSADQDPYQNVTDPQHCFRQHVEE